MAWLNILCCQSLSSLNFNSYTPKRPTKTLNWFYVHFQICWIIYVNMRNFD